MEDNILRYSYNIDSGYVEVIYKDSSVLKVKCEEVEERLNLNMVTESVLQKLLDENPVEYVAMALANELEEYCKLQCRGRGEQYDSLLNQYLELGYGLKSAEALVREFYRYDS